MQTVTAEIAAVLLALTGVPAHLEGVFITTPTGYFEVAEACAGVKFLIAMVAFGALVANVCFRAWPRRIAFIAVALVVPILANGVRAWGTIYVAHLTGSLDFAASFDHVVYGGIFFADRHRSDPRHRLALLRPRPRRSLVRSRHAAATATARRRSAVG